MTLYTFLRIVIEYKKGNPEMVQLLAHNQICALPIINIDGYARIEEIYRKTHKLQEIRKNRSPSKCNE
jgi:Zinc carboxypeptidase.